MAEIQESGNKKKGGKNKQKKMTVRVDFTPMVDMNMLLITFFMLCTSLSKPQTMEISMPSNDKNVTEEQSPVGQLTLQIVERDPCKSIKLATTNSPLPFNMWIQLVETAEEECNVKVTIEIDINPFMKAMVQKPLQEGLEKMVEMLAVINY